MGEEFSDFMFRVEGEFDNEDVTHHLGDDDDEGYSSSISNDVESTIHYGSSIVAAAHSYSDQWPRSYKETTDSLSIAASPSGLNILRQAHQSITQSLNNITLSRQDIGAKAPFLTANEKSKEQIADKFSSTLTWSSTFSKGSFFQVSPEHLTHYRCNVTQTVFNGFSLFVGIGLLSVPSTIQQGGWASMGLLPLYAGLCIYTSFLLTKCMQVNKDIFTFPDLGEAAFGKYGRIFVSVLFYIELYFSCVEFIMLEADNDAKLFPNASFQWGAIYLSPVHFLGIIAALIVLPTCYLRDFRKISFISAGGVLGVTCIALSLILVSTTEDVGFRQSGPIVKWNGLPYALGVFGFCYSGHSVLPNLYHSMSDKKKFPKALTIIFAMSISIYLFVGISGFLMFGEDTNSQITLNLPTNAPTTTTALWMTVLSPLFKHKNPLLLNPLARSLEELLPSELSNSWWGIIPLRTALVFSSVCVAFLVPFFGYVMAFTGSLLCLLASIVVPSLAYLKVAKNPSLLQRITCYAVATIGSILATSGTYSSIYAIIESY